MSLRLRFDLRQVAFVLLCVATFLVPWEELLGTSGFVTGTFMASTAALLVSLFAVLSRAKAKALPVPLLVLGLFVFWCFLSLLWTVDRQATQAIITTYVSLLLFTWMLWEFVDSRARLLTLLRSYLLGCCVSVAMLMLAYIVGRQVLVDDTTRYTGGGLNQNNYALLISVGIVVAAYLGTIATSRWKVAYWLFIVPASISILLTGSRTGAAALVAALGVALLISCTGNKRALLLLVLALGSTAWLIPNVVPAVLLERVTEGTGVGTFVQRLDQWRIGIEVWSGAPWIGVGAGAFVTAVVDAGGRALVAHNTFVQVLTENGLVGLALMLVVWALLIRDAWRTPGKERFLWLGAALVWTISATTLSLEYYKITWFIYAWIMLQRALLLESRERKYALHTRGQIAESDLQPERSN